MLTFDELMDVRGSRAVKRAVMSARSGPDMWNNGRAVLPTEYVYTEPKPGATGVRVFQGATDMVRDRHTYLLRTADPDMYEPAERDTFLEGRLQESLRRDQYDWDCHRCRMAVFTDTITAPCPYCGHKL